MEYYAYASTRACYDPARTIFVFAPQQDAATLQGAARFARTSGWQALAEYDGAVLIVPIAPQGWQAEPDSSLTRYATTLPAAAAKAFWGGVECCGAGRPWCIG